MNRERWNVRAQEVWDRSGVIIAETAEEAEEIARNGTFIEDKEFGFSHFLDIVVELEPKEGDA